MPKSQFVAAGRLKPLLMYFAAAFVVVLALGALLPDSRARSLLVVAWVVFFPVGAWLVFRRA